MSQVENSIVCKHTIQLLALDWWLEGNLILDGWIFEADSVAAKMLSIAVALALVSCILILFFISCNQSFHHVHFLPPCVWRFISHLGHLATWPPWLPGHLGRPPPWHLRNCQASMPHRWRKRSLRAKIAWWRWLTHQPFVPCNTFPPAANCWQSDGRWRSCCSRSWSGDRPLGGRGWSRWRQDHGGRWQSFFVDNPKKNLIYWEIWLDDAGLIKWIWAPEPKWLITRHCSTWEMLCSDQKSLILCRTWTGWRTSSTSRWRGSGTRSAKTSWSRTRRLLASDDHVRLFTNTFSNTKTFPDFEKLRWKYRQRKTRQSRPWSIQLWRKFLWINFKSNKSRRQIDDTARREHCRK